MRPISNPLIREFVYGGHLGALGAPSIAASAAILLGRTPTFALLLMAYLFTYGAYMLNRGSDITQDIISNPVRTHYLTGRGKYLTTISGICFAIGYVVAFNTNLVFFVALLLPLILALGYSIGSKKLIRVIGARRLKEKLLVKNVAISFGWSLIPILVGLYYQNVSFLLLSFGPFIFLRIMSNTVFFDLRDVKSDGESGVRTIPAVYGSSRAHTIMTIIDAASAAYVAVLALTDWFPIYSMLMIVLPVYAIIYRYFSKRQNADMEFLSDVVADGEDILWGPLMIIGEIL